MKEKIPSSKAMGFLHVMKRENRCAIITFLIAAIFWGNKCKIYGLNNGKHII